jgi:hypothetical protein
MHQTVPGKMFYAEMLYNILYRRIIASWLISRMGQWLKRFVGFLFLALPFKPGNLRK